MPLVEHQFVTTLEAAAYFDCAEALLGDAGFTLDAREPQALAASLGLARLRPPGVPRATRATLRLEFDRGRVSVAALVPDLRRIGPEHAQFLLALARHVEHGIAPDAAVVRQSRERWAGAELALKRAIRRRWRNYWIVVGVIVALFATLIALFALAARRG